MADVKKAEGNREYAKKNYEEAVKLYTEAIGNILVETRITWNQSILEESLIS